MPASFASCKTSSQPLSTPGVSTITSISCSMNSRIRMICSSSTGGTSATVRSTPKSRAALWMDCMFAFRQPLFSSWIWT